MAGKKPLEELTQEELIRDNRTLYHRLKELKKTRLTNEESKDREFRVKFVTFLNSIPFPIWIFDSITYRFLLWNDAAVSHYGYKQEEYLKMTPFDFHPPDEFEKVRVNIDIKNPDTPNSYTHITKDGRHRKVETTTTDIFFDSTPSWMTLIRDVTERVRMEEELYRYKYKLEEMVNERTIEVILTNKKLQQEIRDRQKMEKQLIQTQKMEAIGTLAGGIAHDFNNILGGIMGYAELAIRKTDKEIPVYRYIEQILSASQRAKELVKQIFILSRHEDREKQPIQPGLIIKEVLKLIRSSVPTTIEIISKIEDNQSFVLGDPTQIHQILMNLCTNAAHAMREKGGIMEVRLSREEIEDGIYKGLKPGPHLRISVSDTGHGIKPEHIDKIFDPFFTTKKEGEGTGMGLAVVQSIIHSHNGHISVFSKENEGAVFTFYLPITVEAIKKQETQDTSLPGGKESILLVEDDEALAEAEKKLLGELGYNVTLITSSIEAVKIFLHVPQRFDLIITDYTMPKLRGDKFICEIRKHNTHIPIILCTGYSDIMPQERIEELRIGEIIMKPIELGHIARTIRRLLEKN